MRRSLKRLLPYVRRARRSFLLGLACSVCATGVAQMSPLVLKYTVDGLMAGLRPSRLIVYAALLVGIAVVTGGFTYLTRMWMIGASRQIEYDLRNDFFAHLERLPLGYYQAHRTGDLMSRATNDLNAVRMMIGPAVMYLANTGLGFVVAVAMMMRISGRLTLVALVPMPFVSVATHYFGKAIHDRFERIQAQLSDMSAVVQEALAGVRVIRAYRQEDTEIARFRRSNDEYVSRNRGLIRLQAAFYPTLTLCFGLSAASLLWLGGRDVIAKRLTLGDFVALSRYLVMLSWPMIAFGWVVNLAQRGMASWERMLEVMDTAPAITDSEARASVASTEIAGRVEFRHVTFRYPGATGDILHDVSFVAEPGHTVAIVGPTGSGKSTLINLLPRMHEPPAGTVFIDGVGVREMPLHQLRRVVAVVPQEPFLFSDTVGGNIAFGVDGRTDASAIAARIAASATVACFDSDVARFPKGYDTLVGERGITLSGGQKQRTALARALAADPRILILDDALSAVDTHTEATMLARLNETRRACTRIVVAHRVSTVRDADLILVLAAGRIVERGTHDTLVAAGGMYADMHQRQLLEDELQAS